MSFTASGRFLRIPSATRGEVREDEDHTSSDPECVIPRLIRKPRGLSQDLQGFTRPVGVAEKRAVAALEVRPHARIAASPHQLPPLVE